MNGPGSPLPAQAKGSGLCDKAETPSIADIRGLAGRGIFSPIDDSVRVHGNLLIGTTVRMLSTEQLAFYDAQGYLIVEGANTQAVQRLRDALESVYAREGECAGSEGSVNPGVRRLCNLFAKHEALTELAQHRLALQVARHTIGEDFRWQAMNFHDPLPGETQAHQGLHADRGFFPNCEGYMNVCWAIDDMTEANGATRIVPGSHRRPWARDVLTADQLYAPIEGEIYAECLAGSAVFVHGDTWHGGRANATDATRRVVHLGFACPRTSPQYDIAGAFTAGMRSALGANAALLPPPPEHFGFPHNPHSRRTINESAEQAGTAVWSRGGYWGE